MSYIVRELKDGDCCFWLAISCLANNFSLIVLKGKNAYTATVSAISRSVKPWVYCCLQITSEYLEKQSKPLKQDFAQYCENLKQYFEEKSTDVTISFKEAQKVLDVNFIISSGSSVKYFSVELIDVKLLQCVVDFLVNN